MHPLFSGTAYLVSGAYSHIFGKIVFVIRFYIMLPFDVGSWLGLSSYSSLFLCLHSFSLVADGMSIASVLNIFLPLPAHAVDPRSDIVLHATLHCLTESSRLLKTTAPSSAHVSNFIIMVNVEPPPRHAV